MGVFHSHFPTFRLKKKRHRDQNQMTKRRKKAYSKPKANHEASKRKSKAGWGGVGQWGGWKDEERIPPL
jgi:hypothetical protein